GSVGTGNDENQTGSGEKNEEDRTRVGSKLVAEQFGVDCVVTLIRVGVRVVLLHGGIHGTQLGTCLLERGARCQPTEKLRHAMDSASDHRGRKMMRTCD